MDTISERVVEQLKLLPLHLQWRVLEFARALAISTPKGTPGKELAEFAGTITAEDAEQMRAAIEQAFESVSPAEPLTSWTQVYSGLSDDEVQEIQEATLRRQQE